MEQVKRNLERFPQDFMFRLTIEEWTTIPSQNADSDDPEIINSTDRNNTEEVKHTCNSLCFY
jgi:ORF6N domain